MTRLHTASVQVNRQNLCNLSVRKHRREGDTWNPIPLQSHGDGKKWLRDPLLPGSCSEGKQLPTSFENQV